MASDGRYYFRRQEAWARDEEKLEEERKRSVGELDATEKNLRAALNLDEDEHETVKRKDSKAAVAVDGWRHEWAVEIGSERIMVRDIVHASIVLRMRGVDAEPEILLVTREKGGSDWDLPMGSAVGGETGMEASQRQAEEYAGVLSKVVTDLGWFVRGKEREIGVHVFVLETVKETDWAEEFVRERKWYALSDAVTLCDDLSNSDLECVLSAFSSWFANRKAKKGLASGDLNSMDTSTPDAASLDAPVSE